MRPTLWAEVKRSLADAMVQPLERREAFVRERCAEPHVRDEVIRLVQWCNRQCASRADGPADGTASGADARPEAADPGAAAAAAAVRTSPGGAADGPLEDGPGAVVARRYELGEQLGAGAFGTVYRARDRVTGDAVAVKLVMLAGDAGRRAMRREVGVLRRSRLPGIVELLDDGIEHGWAYLVMRLVEGRPFPGALARLTAEGTASWQDVAPRALSFVEALGRLHWLGVVHRDLKPENVLVDAAGVVTIVDFGVARAVEDFGEAAIGYLVGTPTYLAPERLDGSPATIASDLYALGAVLYEVMAGGPPREAASIGELIRRRNEPAAPLASLAPDAPPHVAATIDALVHVDPARRPRSARLVAALLRGEGAQGARIRLSWIGNDAAVCAVVEAVTSRRALDLAGPVGSGRSGTLDEAERRLAALGYRVARPVPATEPFASLVAVVGASERPDAARALAEALLRTRLQAGSPVFADDWDAIDPSSRELLESLRDAGPLVRVLTGAHAGAVEIAPRDETSLRALFAGPDRLFHLREDGARELWRRTRGRPADLARELESWVDAGIARWEDGLVVLDRPGIERLEARISMTLPHAPAVPAGLTAPASDVAAVLEIAGCAVPPAAVATVLGRDVGGVRRDLDRLAAAGLARVHANGDAEAILSIDAAAAWDPRRRRDAHATIADALPAASEQRLHHLVAADRADLIPAEALAVGARVFREGRIESAVLAASSGLAAARGGAAGLRVRDGLLVLAVDCALASGTVGAIDRAAAEVSRAEEQTPTSRTLDLICQAARSTLVGHADRAIEVTDDLEPCDSPEVERFRHTVRMFAARLTTRAEVERRALAGLFGWARRRTSRSSIGVAREALGWRRYRQARFRSAAWLHVRSAESLELARARITAITNAASALLEAGEFARAKASADQAADLAAARRLPTHEARAVWIQRSVAYRTCAVLAPDAELVRAAVNGITPSFAALVLLGEAAILFRDGRWSAAAAVADLASASALTAGAGDLELLSLALASGARGGLSAEQRARLSARIRRTRLEPVRLQAIALHLMSGPAAAESLPPDVLRSVRLEPAAARSGVRREVLSEREWSEVIERFPGAAGKGGLDAV